MTNGSPTHAAPSPTSRCPVANQSLPISNQSAINRQPFPDWSLTFMDSYHPPVANQSPTGRWLITDWLQIDLQLKNGGFDCMVVSLVAAFFWSEGSCKQVPMYVWPGLKLCFRDIVSAHFNSWWIMHDAIYEYLKHLRICINQHMQIAQLCMAE